MEKVGSSAVANRNAGKKRVLDQWVWGIGLREKEGYEPEESKELRKEEGSSISQREEAKSLWGRWTVDQLCDPQRASFFLFFTFLFLVGEGWVCLGRKKEG